LFYVLLIRDKHRDKYVTTLYRKPTNKNRYLLYESNQYRRYNKLGLIRHLTTRILLICSNDEYKHDEIKLMKESLINNGYPYHMIRRSMKEGENVVKRMIN
jgi:hypothetical protein